MSYCVKHDTTFHTQTCERCGDESTITRLTAEVERLRASKKRLANEVRAWRQAWKREDITYSKDSYGDAVHGNPCPHVQIACLDCDAHNDLAPPAKEDSDGPSVD